MSSSGFKQSIEYWLIDLPLNQAFNSEDNTALRRVPRLCRGTQEKNTQMACRFLGVLKAGLCVHTEHKPAPHPRSLSKLTPRAGQGQEFQTDSRVKIPLDFTKITRSPLSLTSLQISLLSFDRIGSELERNTEVICRCFSRVEASALKNDMQERRSAQTDVY